MTPLGATISDDSSSGLRPAWDGVRVLVVDDEPAIRDLLAEILRDQGLMVDVAGDGNAALVLAAQTSYALVLLDLNLPGMDGRMCMSRLRVLHPDLRVLVVTGFDPKGGHGEGLEAADGVLTKPFDLRALRRMVSLALSARR